MAKKTKASKKDKDLELKKKKKAAKAETPTKGKKVKAAKPTKATKPAKGGKGKAKAAKEVKAWKAGRAKLNEKNLVVCSPVNEDLKPAWYEIRVTTEADGMLGSKIEGRRYVGAIEADKDERKVFDMSTYDQETLRAILARLSAVLFHATGKPVKNGTPTRLQPNTEYILHCRLSITKENTIKASVNKVFVQQENKKGRVKLVELDKKDYQVRKLRRVNKYFPIAWQNAAMPPKPERRTRRQQAEDE